MTVLLPLSCDDASPSKILNQESRWDGCLGEECDMDERKRGSRSISRVSAPSQSLGCTRGDVLILFYRRLLESGTFSDTQIRCGKRIWKVHKAILCIRSEWFKKALTGQFMVSAYSYVLHSKCC